MGKLSRCITTDGTVTAMALDSTDLVGRMERIHETSAVNSAALGRLLTAASLMGSLLKGERASLTLRLAGDGPAGLLIAVSDSMGNVRGYIENSVVELPLNEKGKLDVAGTVGRTGSLTVIRDLGMREPYVGQTPIISGEIAEDITHYYAVSEQTPTVCALGVLVAPDLTIRAAGGLLIQLLPTASEETAQQVERCVQGLPPITQMLENGLTPEEICRRALPEFELETLASTETGYVCNCSRARVERALISLGREELERLAQEGHTEVVCHFCGKKYGFSGDDLHTIIEQAKRKKTENHA